MIAFASFCARGEISGISTWFEGMARRLQQAQVPLSVLLHGIGEESHESPVFQSLRRAGVDVTLEAKPSYTEDGIRATLRYLDRVRPTVFVPQCLEHFFYAANITANQGLPWIFTIHSDDPLYWAVSRVVDLTHPRCELVGVSQHICDVALRMFGKSATRIPCGAELAASTTSYRSSPFRVIFSGRVIEEQKRISLVVRAMELACRQHRGIECLILGDGPQRREMEEYVGTKQLAKRIRFLGRLGREQIWQQLCDAQAILMMSDYEGLPVALLEAMSAGVVPVARWIDSGIPEIVHHEGTGLRTTEDPQNAADSLVRLASDEALWSACSRAAQELTLREYGEDRCFQRWRALIERVDAQSGFVVPSTRPQRMVLPPVPAELARRDIRRRTLGSRLRSLMGRAFGNGKEN